jgi:hypothetical protein
VLWVPHRRERVTYQPWPAPQIVGRDRLSAMGRPLAALVAVATIVVGLAGCTTHVSATTTTTAVPKTATSTAPDPANTTVSGFHVPRRFVLTGGNAEAAAMLRSIVLPPGSQQVAPLTQAGLRKEAQRPACNPLIDKSRYWTVRGTLGQVDSFLSTHPEAGRTTSTSGSFNSPQYSGDFVAEVPTDQSVRNQSELVATFINIENGEVGIRADAEVVPPGADCASSGGGDASSSGGAAAS